MVKSLVCTKEIAIKAYLLGACKLPRVGKSVKRFSTSDLIWAEENKVLERGKLKLPLWVMSGNGGYGDGYGDGDGSGYGYGYGYRYGS